MNLERLADLEGQYRKGMSVSDEIDLLCDEFEQEWRSGRRPQIDAYVGRVDPSCRSQLYSELLAVDFEYRQKELQQANFEALFTTPNGGAQQTIKDGQVATAAGETPPQPVVSIAHYELGEKIGVGGFGTVWRARDIRLNRTVALKISRNEFGSAANPDRFVREARIAARLNHPGIVRVYEVNCDRERAFIVSEFIAGTNLDRWFATTAQSAGDAAVMCRKIALSLEYAHRNGVIHRDLKPANIIVDAAGEPHIADFGLAKCLTQESAHTVEGQLLGTPAYMSPEQASGRANEVDARSDIYGLGVILYQLLAGQVPFDGPMATVLQQIVNDEPVVPRAINAHVPRDLESVCLKAMAKDPADRYATAQDLADDLERYLNGEHTVARPCTILERAWRRCRKNSLKTGGAAFLALMVPLASVLSWNGARRLSGPAVPAASTLPAAAALRSVLITTDPPGARLAIAPMDEQTWRPVAAEVVRPHGKTPLTVDLAPGTYLIVADIPGRGFNEAYRRVPQAGELIANGMRALQSQEHADGMLELASIRVRPESEVIGGLALFQGGRFLMGDDREDGVPIHECDIKSFYLATHEVTVAEFLKYSDGKLPDHVVGLGLPLDEKTHAITGVTFSDALAYAESLGLRLPTEEEHEFASTAGGTRRFPWGDDDTRIDDWKFDPAGEPAFDCTDTTPPVYGLYSNVAEWTESRRALGPDVGPATLVPEMIKMLALHSRVVRGGGYSVAQRYPDYREIERGPRWGVRVTESEHLRGLGFRCARSASPRFLD